MPTVGSVSYDCRIILTAVSASLAVMSGRTCRTVRTASSVLAQIILTGCLGVGEGLAG